MSKKYKIYHDLTSDNTSHSKIIKCIKAGSSILEFGCANGDMSKYLSENLKCKVSGVEIDNDSLKEALPYLTDSFCGDIDEFKWLEYFEGKHFDYITFGDVLEHLKNPKKVIESVGSFLKEDGCVIFTVPNIAHVDIVNNLIMNRFDYKEIGLLDKTHIHFFAYNNVLELFDGTGLGLTTLDATYMEEGLTEQAKSNDYNEFLVKMYVGSNPHSEIYQFFGIAQKRTYIEKNNIQFDLKLKQTESKLSYFIDYGSGYTQDDLQIVYGSKTVDSYCFTLKLPDGAKSLRIDPIEKKRIILNNVVIKSNHREFDFISNGFAAGSFLVFDNLDPQISITEINSKDNYIYISYEMVVLRSDLINLICGSISLNHDISTLIETFKTEKNEIEAKYLAVVRELESGILTKEQECSKLLVNKKEEYEKLLADKEVEREKLLVNKKEEYEKLLADKEVEREKLLAGKKAEYEKLLAGKKAEYEKLLADKEMECAKLLADKETAYERLFADKKSEYEKLLTCKEGEYAKKLSEEEHSYKTSLEELKNQYSSDISRMNGEKAELLSQVEVLRRENGELLNNYSFYKNKFYEISNSEMWKLTKPCRVVISGIKKSLRKFILTKNLYKFLGYWKNKGFKAAVHKTRLKLKARKKTDVYTKNNILSAEEYALQKNTVFPKNIKISILVPLYRTEENYLNEMLNSVINQTYSNWQLCLADGSCSKEYAYITGICTKLAKKDSRIKYKKLAKNLGISDNTNECDKIADGEYIALLDHDDLLHPSALYEVMKAICEKNAEFIYTDEDKITGDGKSHYDAYFKPDFAFDNLRANNYICHLSVFKRSLIKGSLFNRKFDGSQDHDLMLRIAEKAKNIYHIPKVLYHWRALESSVASDPFSKTYTIEAGINAVSEHLKRMGYKGEVTSSDAHPNFYRIKYKIEKKPLISIIIPNKDHIDDLEKCLDSILKNTEYKNYEILIVENNSEKNSTFNYYKRVKRNDKIKVITWKGGFNYSAINNFAVKQARGDYLVLLNNDVEIISPQWIEEMLMLCQRREVGAVGAKLYYSDNTLQHAGVILGIGGVAGHSHKYFNRSEFGYFGRLIIQQNISAVTAACMMIKKSVFDEVGGFDEGFAIAFNDVDLCMKVRQAGYLICWTPYAEAYHHESKSRGYEDTAEKQIRFAGEINLFNSKWGDLIKKGDPYYNTNLTLISEDFSLK